MNPIFARECADLGHLYNLESRYEAGWCEFLVEGNWVTSGNYETYLESTK